MVALDGIEHLDALARTYLGRGDRLGDGRATGEQILANGSACRDEPRQLVAVHLAPRRRLLRGRMRYDLVD